MTVDDMVFYEMEIGDALPALRGVAGIIGWDILIRARVQIELDGPAMELFDPAVPHPEEVPWQELNLHGKTPHVRGRLEGGQEGLFILDTGAVGASIVFHSPTVERLGLLEEGDTGQARFRGAGGFSRYSPGETAWVEVGGHAYRDMAVRFSTDPSGAMADPYTLGNVGINILSDFRLLIDYPHHRIAMIKR